MLEIPLMFPLTMEEQVTDWEGDLALDLIQVETCVPCAPPASFTATVVDPNTVDLTWIDGPVATDSFFVEYGREWLCSWNGYNLNNLVRHE